MNFNQFLFNVFLETHYYHFVEIVAYHHPYYLPMTLFEKCHIPVYCFLENLKYMLTDSFDFPYKQLQKYDFDTLHFEIKFRK